MFITIITIITIVILMLIYSGECANGYARWLCSMVMMVMILILGDDGIEHLFALLFKSLQLAFSDKLLHLGVYVRLFAV